MRNRLKLAIIAGLCVAATVTGLTTPAKAQGRDRLSRQMTAAEQQKPAQIPAERQTRAPRITAWPIVIEDPQGIFVYATEGATNRGISPYQNNLAIGFKTLNPVTHRSPSCNSSAGFDGFCGDEVAFGDFTLQYDVSGRDNTAIGDHALANLVSGQGNTAVGSSAAANIHTSGGVDAFGVAACQNATDYRGPITCIGQAALEFAEPSSQSTVAVGYQAGLQARDAQFSTIVGTAAGFSATTDSYSVVIGASACHNAVSMRNVICIGTINGPARGGMSDTLWLGGSNGTAPILYGDLTTNSLGLNTTNLAQGAALTVAGGNIALPAGSALQWNGDAGISRTAAGSLAIGNGIAANASGILNLGQVTVSSNVNISSPAQGELDIGAGSAQGTGGHIVAAYVRTVPIPVASLPKVDPAPQLGDRAMVVDSEMCTFGIAVKGGGALACPVYYNGIAWTAG